MSALIQGLFLASKINLTNQVFRTEGFLLFKDCPSTSFIHLPFIGEGVGVIGSISAWGHEGRRNLSPSGNIPVFCAILELCTSMSKGEWINVFKGQSLKRRNPSFLETDLAKNILAVRESSCINLLT